MEGNVLDGRGSVCRAAAMLLSFAAAAALFGLTSAAEAAVESIPATQQWYHATCMSVARPTPELACEDGNNGTCKCCSDIGPGSGCSFAGLVNYRPDWQGCNWTCPGTSGVITRGVAAAGGVTCPTANPPYTYNKATGMCERTLPDCSPTQCAAQCSSSSFPIQFPSLKLVDESGSVPCPSVFGGSAGVKVSMSAQYNLQSSTCDTGCTGTESVMGTGEASFTICGKRGHSVNLEASSNTTIKHAKVCGFGSPQYVCETVCDSTARCMEQTTSAALSGGFAWSLGINFNRTASGGTAWPLKLSCKSDVTVNVGGSLTTMERNRTGSYNDPCPSCSSVTVGPTLEGTGPGSCSLDWGNQKTAKVGASLSADYNQAMSFTHKSGECGSENCMTSEFSAQVKADLTGCVSLFGRKVKVAAKGSVGGTCSGSTCSGTNNGCEWVPTVKTTVNSDRGACK